MTENRKTILLANLSKKLGGGEVQFLSMAKEFRRLGHSVELVVSEQSELSRRAENERISISFASASKNAFFSPIAVLKVRKLLNRKKPDLVILNSSRELKLFTVATSHKNYNLIYLRGYFGKISGTVLNRFFISRLKHLVAVSEYVLNQGLSEVSDSCINKPVVIHNGIPQHNSHTDIDYSSKKIIAVGRLDTSKRFEFLIEAMRYVVDKIPDAQLSIVGEGTSREFLESQIKRFELLNSVKLTGFSDNIPGEMEKHSIFVHPAKYEAFGLVITEAMRQSLPCIAFSGHAADEIIEDGKTGILIDEQTPEALAKAIISLLKDEEKRKTYGRAGYERFKEKFTVAEQVNRFLELM